MSRLFTGLMLALALLWVPHTASAAPYTANGQVDLSSAVRQYQLGNMHSNAVALNAVAQQIVYAMDYGAVGDSTTDDTNAIQNAIYAVCANPGGAPPYHSGGEVLFGPGVYKFSSVKFPCNGVTLRGVNNGNTNSGKDDWRGTVFRLTTASGQTAMAVGSVTADYGTGIYVADLSIDGSDMDATAWVFDYSWLQHSTVKNVSAKNIPNFFKEKGGAANLIEDVVIMNLSGIGVDFSGSAENCGSNSTTVSLAACNMRADLLRLSRVNMNGAAGYTATCISYHDFAQSLNVDHSICESAKYGINAYCDKSMGNNGEACPAFARFVDYEAEDCTLCINASDIQDWEFSGGYYLGRGVQSTHVVSVVSTNFGGNPTDTQQGPYAQAIRFIGGRFGNAGGSIVFMGVSEFVIANTQMFSAGLTTAGAANVEVSSTGSTTMPERGSIHDNLLCVASGQQPLNLNQLGVYLDTGVNYIKVHDNITVGCTGGDTTAGSTGVTNKSTKDGNVVHDN